MDFEKALGILKDGGAVRRDKQGSPILIWITGQGIRALEGYIPPWNPTLADIQANDWTDQDLLGQNETATLSTEE